MDALTEYQQAVIDRLEVLCAVGVVVGALALALLAFIAISRLHA